MYTRAVPPIRSNEKKNFLHAKGLRLCTENINPYKNLITNENKFRYFNTLTPLFKGEIKFSRINNFCSVSDFLQSYML